MQVVNEDPYAQAARLTIELVNHSHAPDLITDSILETLIEMYGELNINIWLKDFGLSPIELTRLYSQQKKIGGGKGRAILYGDYEVGSLPKRRIGEKLRLIREHFGLSVEEIAERLRDPRLSRASRNGKEQGK